MLIPMNEGWTFYPEGRPDNRQTVRIPHANVETRYNYFSQDEYQFKSIYVRQLLADPAWRDKVVLLTFMAAAHVAEVFVNGVLVMTHRCGYTAFRCDIAGHLDYSAPNEIRVVLDSSSKANVPPFGGLIDYMTYGGIYREVFLDVREKTWIADIFAHGDRHRHLTVRAEAKGLADGCSWRFILHREGVVLADNRSETPELDLIVEQAELWSVDNPALYYLTAELWRHDHLLDSQQIRFGFRTCGFTDKGCYLNGEHIRLIGLNRHQSYPYVGYAMPARAQRRDAEILKNELKVNCVRTSHYPQSQHFIDACDELGLLVLTEIPGWQHIGDAAWQETVRDNVREMVTQYRNHPSVILWGVRINESQDCDELYRDTNAIARTLDPTRQTCGVRYIRHSHLLEDVYTFNDFTYDGGRAVLQQKRRVTKREGRPYLITEFNGHMFPTKMFDSEAHRLEHALRHATVLDALAADPDIAGGLGWCMCDYNTNKDFGSGDHICYHGVLDMFRNPKLAAAAYASQSDEGAVLVPGSFLSKGEYPAARTDPVYVFTNADSIRLFRNGTQVREFPARSSRFSHLDHPPVMIDDFIGNVLENGEGFSRRNANRLKTIINSIAQTGPSGIKPWNYVRLMLVRVTSRRPLRELIGLITRHVMGWGSEDMAIRLEAVRDGDVMATAEIGEMLADHLEAVADATELREGDTYDVASIRIRALDRFGNVLPYLIEPVKLQCSGDIELIGPDLATLRGGQGGAYVRTAGRTGDGQLTLTCAGLPPVQISFSVK